MSANDEKPSTSRTLSIESNDESLTFEDLMKRFACAQAGIKKSEASYYNFLVKFRDFNKLKFFPKKGGSQENKSGDEILKLLLSEPPMPTPPSSPEPQSSTSSAALANKCHNTLEKRPATISNSKNLSNQCETDNDDPDYQNFSNGEDISNDNNHNVQEYPKKTANKAILGPNGTEVKLEAYNAINFTSSAGATRQLLGLVFSSDILATHTLTGKPSPAFYGRERPEKMQLDQNKIADIIHCVRTIKKCTEREVRAAITTKCSDTSKKYKRRSQKQLKSIN